MIATLAPRHGTGQNCPHVVGFTARRSRLRDGCLLRWIGAKLGRGYVAHWSRFGHFQGISDQQMLQPPDGTKRPMGSVSLYLVRSLNPISDLHREIYPLPLRERQGRSVRRAHSYLFNHLTLHIARTNDHPRHSR